MRLVAEGDLEGPLLTIQRLLAAAPILTTWSEITLEPSYVQEA